MKKVKRNKQWFRGLKWAEAAVADGDREMVEQATYYAQNAFDQGARDYLIHLDTRLVQ